MNGEQLQMLWNKNVWGVIYLETAATASTFTNAHQNLLAHTLAQNRGEDLPLSKQWRSTGKLLTNSY